jgi:hypothetical protein
MWQQWVSGIPGVLHDAVIASWAQFFIYLLTLCVLIRQARILVRQAKSQDEAVRLQTKAIQGSEAARIHQVLVNILMEYRSAEMLLAVRTLWDFYRANPNSFVDVYESTRKREADTTAALSPDQRLQAERATLHYQRRLVSQFYAFLAGLYELGIIPKQILYTYWGEGDLRIIPTILIPIETRLAAALSTSRAPNPTLERMRKLYDDSR